MKVADIDIYEDFGKKEIAFSYQVVRRSDIWFLPPSKLAFSQQIYLGILNQKYSWIPLGTSVLMRQVKKNVYFFKEKVRFGNLRKKCFWISLGATILMQHVKKGGDFSKMEITL